MITHKHHIIPRHMGGGNEVENLIELTIEEHAQAHYELWEKHGKWEDLIAWKALSNQIDKEEIRLIALRLRIKGVPLTEEHRKKLSAAKKGKKQAKEVIQKRNASLKGRKITWDLKATTPEANEKRSKSMIGKPKQIIECPHCNKTGGLPQMKQWHFDNCKEKK